MQICIPVSNNTTGSSQAEQTSATDENNEENMKLVKYIKRKRRYSYQDIRPLRDYFAALQNSNPDVDFTGNLENISLNIPSKDPFRTCPMSGAYIVKAEII